MAITSETAPETDGLNAALSELRALILEIVAGLHVAALNQRYSSLDHQLTELHDQLQELSRTTELQTIKTSLNSLEQFIEPTGKTFAIRDAVNAERCAAVLKSAYQALMVHSAAASRDHPVESSSAQQRGFITQPRFASLETPTNEPKFSPSSCEQIAGRCTRSRCKMALPMLLSTTLRSS